MGGGLGKVQLLPFAPGYIRHKIDLAGAEARIMSACTRCPACGAFLMYEDLASHARKAGDPKHAVVEVMSS